MKDSNNDSKRLKEVPDPPPECGEKVAREFTSLCEKKLENGGLFEHELDEIQATALDTVMEKNAAASRKRRLKQLGLEVGDTVDPRVHLNDGQKFDERFNELTDKYDTYPETWEAVEDEYRAIFGKNKYSSYDSYRTARRKRIKEKNET